MIVVVGDFGVVMVEIRVDVKGMVVSLGFINMLSWVMESLIEDGCFMSGIM